VHFTQFNGLWSLIVAYILIVLNILLKKNLTMTQFSLSNQSDLFTVWATNQTDLFDTIDVKILLLEKTKIIFSHRTNSRESTDNSWILYLLIVV
jgi:hypothetical protein